MDKIFEVNFLLIFFWTHNFPHPKLPSPNQSCTWTVHAHPQKIREFIRAHNNEKRFFVHKRLRHNCYVNLLCALTNDLWYCPLWILLLPHSNHHTITFFFLSFLPLLNIYLLIMYRARLPMYKRKKAHAKSFRPHQVWWNARWK